MEAACRAGPVFSGWKFFRPDSCRPLRDSHHVQGASGCLLPRLLMERPLYRYFNKEDQGPPVQKRSTMKVYVDMDRVIADFDNGVRKYAHMEPAGNGGNKEVAAKMWKRLSKVPHFYDKLDVIPGAERGMQILFEKFGSDLEVLTGVPNPTRGLPTASEDKKIWMKRKFEPEIVVNAVLRAEKIKFCTGRDCLLIDDYERNIKEWEDAGGTGILFEDWDQVLNAVSDLLSQ